ncbi:BC1872 family protein [Bacillus atrophaeus]|uniref:BC1872 family protein n=1 Tax=Bacillus atrophaeus TaxID=1452 RepID=UPI002E1A35B8|nr:hypothetical protein [Bacillus atrophaeus]
MYPFIPWKEGDRALDKFIGEKIMDHTIAGDPDEMFILGGLVAKQPVPFYSSKIEDAWLVVDKLKSIGLEIAIYTDTYTSTCHITDAPSSLMTVWEAETESVPLAICKAAEKMTEDSKK